MSSDRQIRSLLGGGQLLLLVLLVFLAVKLVFLFLLASNSRYVMDEYAQARLVQDLPLFYSELDPIKTVLYVFVFRSAFAFSDTTAGVMLAARVEMACLATAVAALVYLASRRLGRARNEALFSVAVLLSFSNFLERSFRVRSDSVATFFAVAALVVMLGRQRVRTAFLAGLLLGCSFLCTQKAVYACAALGIATLVGGLTDGSRRNLLGQIGGLAGGWVLALVAYSAAFGGSEFPRVLGMVFTSPMSLALHAHERYGGLGRFVLQTLGRNSLPYGLAVGGMAIAGFRFRELDRGERIALLSAGLLAAAVFLHNQPWPYVFIWALPFLALWASEPLRSVINDGSRRRWTLLLLFALSFSLARNVEYIAHSKALQDRVTQEAESYLGVGDAYCDGIGMLVTRHLAGRTWWDAPRVAQLRRELAAGDRTELDRIFAEQPKLWILNYRLAALWPTLGPEFAASYVRISESLLVAGAALVGDRETIFRNRWAGSFQLYGPNGRLSDAPFLIDGKVARGQTALGVGAWRVQLAEGSIQALLLPAGLPLRGPIPVGGEPPDLFAEVYDF